jgi:endonuclease YncB( thermonuclease family)
VTGWPIALTLALLAAAGGARADLLMGRVAAVTTGDTVRVADARSHVEFLVRLTGIRAPDRRHPYGGRSQQVLAALVYGRDVTVEGRFADGRFQGRLRVAAPGCHDPACPRELDSGLEQVRAGMAWWHAGDSAFLSVEERAGYEQAEFQAKIRRLGLWAGRQTLPPWGP